MHCNTARLPIRGLFFILALCVHAAYAIDKSDVERRYHTQFDLYLTAREAYEFKISRPDEVLFIDIRSRQEARYTGIADQVDANIPYRMDTLTWRTKKDGIHGTYRTRVNGDFANAVDNALQAAGLDRGSPVILMCGAGTRSAFAASVLHKAGFEQVYTQVEGFEGVKAKSGEHKGKRSVVAGWKYEGLPWSYDLVAEKMYFNFDPGNRPEPTADGE